MGKSRHGSAGLPFSLTSSSFPGSTMDLGLIFVPAAGTVSSTLPFLPHLGKNHTPQGSHYPIHDPTKFPLISQRRSRSSTCRERPCRWKTDTDRSTLRAPSCSSAHGQGLASSATYARQRQDKTRPGGTGQTPPLLLARPFAVTVHALLLRLLNLGLLRRVCSDRLDDPEGFGRNFSSPLFSSDPTLSQPPAN